MSPVPPPRPAEEGDDGIPWEEPGADGSIRGPFGDDAAADDAAEWPPERAGEDRQARVARRKLLFLLVFAAVVLVPLALLLLELR